MPSKRARRTQGSPTHWAHIVLGVAHHSRVLLKTAKQDKNKRREGKKKKTRLKYATNMKKKTVYLLVGSQNLGQEQIIKSKIMVASICMTSETLFWSCICQS